MKIISLEAENFKILKAIEITPEGNLVTIGGKNGMGKTSVLDAIWVALKGRAVAPPKPIRDGEEMCTIRLDMGDLVVTRTFNAKEGGTYTDRVKVEDTEGRRYPRAQQVLDELLGDIGFDPFEFVRLKPDQQADMLLPLVPLPIDIFEMAAQDEADYETRRDINRDIKSLDGQIDGIAKESVPENAPDKQQLLDRLSNAAEHNSEIRREEQRREQMRADHERKKATINDWRDQVENLQRRIADAAKEADAMEDEIANLDPLAELVDTEALRRQVDEAERLHGVIDRQKHRGELWKQRDALKDQSQALTDAMAKREQEREKALAQAKMPIEGLAFRIENGKPIVTFRGRPFEQASRSEQIRASTAIAMAANPQLRVLRISDGSLLDEDALKIMAEMAELEDFQLFVEVVSSDGGVGFVLENGEVKANGK